jgi:repressor LexA
VPAALSGRLREAWEAVRDYYRDHGLEPTVREVGLRMGLTPPNNAIRYINALKDSGHYAAAVDPTCRVALDSEPWSVPLNGYVCAGAGVANLSEPDADARLSMEELFPYTEKLFALKVRGDSMIGAQIRSGDFAVIRHDPAPKTGEKVVVNIDGELTLKVYRAVRGSVWLWPCNEEHEPIQLCTQPGARVLGVLVGIIRKE